MDALHVSQRGLAYLVLSVLVSTEIVCAKTLYVDPNGVAAYATIAAAVEMSQDGDTVVLLPGTYRGRGNINVRIEDKNLTVQGSDPNDPVVVAATLIDGTADDAEYSRAFAVSGTDCIPNVTIAGLTLTRGARNYQGGAVHCLQANLTLTNCALFGNTATGWGGALYVVDAHATVTGCSFRNNTATDRLGGAVCSQRSTLDLANCIFESNSGSALQAFDSCVTLNRCSFTDNTGDRGGAIYAYVARASIPSTCLILSGCTFVRNTAATSGGALHVDNASTTVTGCTFTSDATAGDGGALYNAWSALTLGNCVFTHNTAAGSGGAVFNWNQSSPRILNCTFVANGAAAGGALAAKMGGETLLRHCVLWDNAAPQGRNLYVGGSATGSASKMTVQYSDVQGGKTAAAVDSGGTLTWDPGNIDAAPLFIGPFQNDYHLSPDSPCIDSGDPTFAGSADEVDLDGNPRIFGSVIDLGAFEYQGLGPVYRFWSPSAGTHFYTISGSERDKLINQYSNVWHFEGIAFYAYFRQSETNLVPVYRFWAPQSGDHLYTSSDSEKEKIRKQMSKDWQYEGVVFYAYPARKQPFGAVPVYRFASSLSGDHFYTASESEKDKLVGPAASKWAYEGVAWYAFAYPSHLTTATYQFTGADKAASYRLTLAAYIDDVKATIDKPLVEFVPQKTQALMTIDFDDMQTTLDAVHIQTRTVNHVATITKDNLTVALTLSAQANFDGLCRRGPFAIDATTNLFADFQMSPEVHDGDRETFSYAGTLTLGGQTIPVDQAVGALQFETEALGYFESLSMLPDGLYARMPLTFQWQRPYASDLLAEASVNGHIVKIYVTNTYVGTLDLWRGQVVE